MTRKLTIRLERPDDREPIYLVNENAFEAKGEGDLVNQLRDGGGLTLSLVATIDSAVVGHIAFSPVTIKSPSSPPDSLVALGPMAVLQKHQNSGIGSALVRRGLEELSLAGIQAVFVLGHDQYYPKFGFRPAKPTFGIDSTYQVDDKYFLALELVADSLKGISGTVSYRPEFAKI